MCGTSIRSKRGSEGQRNLFDLALNFWQQRNRSSCRFRHVTAAPGRDCRGVDHERTVTHSSRRGCQRFRWTRRQCLPLSLYSGSCFNCGLRSLFRLRAATVRVRRFATVTFNHNVARLNRYGAHHLHVAATKQASAGHPYRHDKGQQNSRKFDEQGRFHRQQSTPKNTKVQRPCKCYVTDGLVA